MRKYKELVYKMTAVLLIVLFSFFMTAAIARSEEVNDTESTPPPEEIIDQEQEPDVQPEPESEPEVQTSVEQEPEPESESEPEVQAAVEQEPEPVVNELVTNGGDDTSYKIPLTVSVIYDGVEYTDVYATTNSVITFGNPDGTYWTYPSTPSISIESRDWWALPWMNPDMHFIIRTSEGGFQVDGAYLPYGTSQGEITNIVITAQILSDGTVSYTYSVSGPLYGDERTGARLNDGTVVSLEEAGVKLVDEPVELSPAPVEPEPEAPTDPVEPEEPISPPQPPVQPVNPEPNQPSEPVQPEPEPQPEPSNPQPEPEEQQPEPELEEPETPTEEEEDTQPESPQDPEPPLEEEGPEEELDDKPEPVNPDTNDKNPLPPVQEKPQVPAEPVNPENPPLDNPSVNTIVLPNGVELPIDIVEALEIFDNPSEMLALLFTDPGKVLKALLNVGADMSPEKRDLAQKGAVAIIIVTQVIGASVLSTTRGGK
jgi:hypothetical protein